MLPASPLRSLLIEGMWSGVGSVLVFLPQILLLFLFIGILEDSGYLARAALIADRTMARVGLQGKSFIPLLSAYACAVPAIMATRTIENKRDRIATILIAPFMTCSARLPVYTLIIAAFLPERPLLGPAARHARRPRCWACTCSALPRRFHGARAEIVGAEERAGAVHAGDAALPLAHAAIARAAAAGPFEGLPAPRRHGDPGWSTSCCGCSRTCRSTTAKSRHIGESVAGTIGHVIEPVIRPLGFNWKIGIGLITSLAAREVIVGTLGTIYGMEGGRAIGGTAAGAAQRSHSGRSGRAAGVLRLRHAVHVHHGGGAPRNRRLEVADHPVHLHDIARVYGSIRGEGHHERFDSVRPGARKLHSAFRGLPASRSYSV